MSLMMSQSKLLSLQNKLDLIHQDDIEEITMFGHYLHLGLWIVSD